MNKTRQIREILKSVPTIEGAGVRLKRVFGYHQVPMLDPFLLLDDFRSGNPDDYVKGFPWHPHRGIETITYMLRGEVDHGDSMGNKGRIRPGDVQWMTAGSGVIHQEMPRGEEDGRMGGFQLWANLPASRKMMAPRYREVKRESIPEVSLADGAKAKIICGDIMGTRGPVTDIVTDPEYLDITLQPGASIRHRVKRGHTAFAYVIDGEGYFDEGRDSYAYAIKGSSYFDMTRDCLVQDESLVLFDDGDHVLISAERSAVRFLLISGKPLKEPIAWYGPIVMNTRDELKRAFDEYREGTFIKHGT